MFNSESLETQNNILDELGSYNIENSSKNESLSNNHELINFNLE